MFTPGERAELLDRLVAAAHADEHVAAAALVGSLAARSADRWSDIDLALRLRPGVVPEEVAADWTRRLSDAEAVVDTLDVWAGPALYRVFLLADSLQVDVSFWPYEAFGSTGEPFQVLFGEAGPEQPAEEPDAAVIFGWAWLYALHTRSALGRGRLWQALQMLSDLRGQLIALACLRHGLPAFQGRSADLLPAAERLALVRVVPTAVEEAELLRSFTAALDLLQGAAAAVDPELASRLDAPLWTMRTVSGTL